MTLAPAPPGTTSAAPSASRMLTGRELQVVARVAQVGRTRPLLGLAEVTAKRHVRNIVNKLGLESRMQLAL
jgi:DNA-binding NarL/FixJ family response regulator